MDKNLKELELEIILKKYDEVLNELYYLFDTKSEAEVEAYYRSLLWQ